MAEPASLSLLIQPRDPLLLRDGRPFTADPGARAVTLPWPLPQTIAGALRTHIGTMQNCAWTAEETAALQQSVRIRGPLLLGQRAPGAGWSVYFAAPADAVLYDEGNRLLCRRPLAAGIEGSGTNIPDGLQPAADDAAVDAKPSGGRPFWSLSDVARWLSERRPTTPPQDTLAGPPGDTRIHVSIDRVTGTSAEGLLFSTRSLVFGDQSLQRRGEDSPRPAMAMLCRVEGTPTDWPGTERLFTFGGEGRLSALTTLTGNGDLWPRLPVSLTSIAGTRLRLQLATPGIFRDGWRPGWLNADLIGEPPNRPGLALRLVSACVSRPVAISGWDLHHRRQKPTRYAAPAGSVYFFESVAGRPLTQDDMQALWLTPVSDATQDQIDGYGLAMPGVW